ncbi:sensor histidine kinase [Paraferrimonas sedimenticola]|uniref:histidine kinase n=1 Tax=Paraferrimonas sedimenticola TaxID=375674 RepID=A0AA37W0P3_9GAMM|nr:HAMP domain-containing sensor histidine kinase [Paraferrimonas sedimenticola]GLP95713.1 hypothetical protein GCM10007895_10190 [Paraferrimonas sedimenticola]
MSLTKYLFSWMTGLIVLMAVVQAGWIVYAGQKIETEIAQQSQALSFQIVNRTLQSIPELPEVPALDSQRVRELLRQNQWRYADDDNIRILANESGQLQVVKFDEQQKPISLIVLPLDDLVPSGRENFRRELESMLLQVQQEFGGVNTPDLAPTVTRLTPQAGHYRVLLNNALAVIAVTSVFALLLAFWLSRHISAPLSQLSSGLSRLAKGELGVQLPPSGKGESAQALSDFNQSSEQLRQLSERQQQLKDKQHLAEIGEVSRGLAHALRNPLHTLGLYCEQVTPNELQQSMRQKLAHLNQTISALLRLATGPLDRSQPLSLKALVDDVAMELSASRSSDGVVHIDNQLPRELQILGNYDEWRVVLHTLMVNGVEASQAGQTVTVSAETQASRLQISVKDSGAGIDPQVLPRLFEAHVSGKPQGAGMGLYIAKRLLSLYYRANLSVFPQEQGTLACIELVLDEKSAEEH